MEGRGVREEEEPEQGIDGVLVVPRHEIRLQVVKHPLAACVSVVPRRRLLVNVRTQCASMHRKNTVLTPASASARVRIPRATQT